MSRKEKPVQACGKTRVSKLHLAHDTPPPDHFQCPRCKLAGNADLFQLGWPERLHELIARISGMGFDADLHSMNWQELLGLYKGLCKHGCKKK